MRADAKSEREKTTWLDTTDNSITLSCFQKGIKWLKTDIIELFIIIIDLSQSTVTHPINFNVLL